MHYGKTLREWFTKPLARIEFWKLLRDAFMLQLAFTVIAIFVLNWVEPSAAESTADNNVSGELMKIFGKNAYLATFAVVATVIFEETLFRLLPLGLGLVILKYQPRYEWVLWTLVFTTSLGFGLVHLSNYDNVTKQSLAQVILFQGIGGLVLSCLFLKVTRLQVSRALHGFGASTLFHLIWNTVFITPLLLNAQI